MKLLFAFKIRRETKDALDLFPNSFESKTFITALADAKVYSCLQTLKNYWINVQFLRLFAAVIFFTGQSLP